MFSKQDQIQGYDDALLAAMNAEEQRQEDHIELIASENYTSPAVMEAQGSGLTNKYAEGYPGKRYYGGCEYVDMVEQLAIDRAKATVRRRLRQRSAALRLPGQQRRVPGPAASRRHHPGHEPGPRRSPDPRRQRVVLGQAVQRRAVRHRHQHRPDRLRRSRAPGRRAQAENDRRRFLCLLARPSTSRASAQIADKVGAYLFVDMAHVAGLVAAGLYPNPLPYADVVTTTTHKTLRGPRGGLILAKSNAEIEKKLNAAVFPGAQGGPLMHVIAAKAVCFKEALEPGFKAYQQQVIDNAQAMASVFIERGYDVVSGGTDNHLFLVSLIRQGLTGKDADAALGRAHITVNKNAVPNDPQSPFVTSGLRIGTPAVTTRGFKEAQCIDLAGWICDILDNLGDADVEANVAEQVAALCADFPVYR